MSGTTVKVDEKGRVIIPKGIREIANLREGSCLTIKAKGKTIILEPVEPVADKFFGAFKVTKWPENIDDFTAEVLPRKQESPSPLGVLPGASIRRLTTAKPKP